MKRVVPVLGFGLLLAAAPPPEFGERGMVATDHRLASQAGASVMEIGGNAVDAAVAAALAAGVVQAAGSGLGGGGFALIVTPSGEASSLDFREIAPAAAHRDLFVDAEAPMASRDGGLAVAAPGEAPGLAELHRRYGSLSLYEVAKPAIHLARKGFPVGYQLHKSFGKLGDSAEAFVEAFLRRPDVPVRGEEIRRPRLAKALKDFAKTGGKALTHGWVAQDIVASATASGGILELGDLQANQPRDRDPVEGSYRGWKIYSMAPPSSGGLVLVQCLKVLEATDVPSLGHNSAGLLHLYAETFQHAFADRANYMGDPGRIEVPMEALLSEDRIQAVRSSFDPATTLPPESYGAKLDIGRDSGTQHISVIDGEGFSVSLTTTINTAFGSKVVGAESGIVLNNEMDDFVARPGVPNAYGLVGSEANAVAPHAVPLSSMSPTVLLSPDGKERIAIGASGGPFIISSTLQSIVNIVDFGMDPSEAVSAPVVHHQWAPRLLFVDSGISPDTAKALEARGHTLKRMEFFSSVQVVRMDGEGYSGASDPRKGGWPVGI
jgi:gamma-glutamyltranspeptidase / glutathione hydrolase